jgi:hypothetical protein
MGVSRTVANGKTTEFEFLQIRDLPEGLTYIAKPSNQPEAKFVASTKTANEVVFENPKHDFPQRIRYRLKGDTLHARRRRLSLPARQLHALTHHLRLGDLAIFDWIASLVIRDLARPRKITNR